MKIDNKWKEFALLQTLSDWTGDTVALFDALYAADYGESEAVLEEYLVDVWHPFEHWSCDDISEHIIQLAEKAQRTEQEITHA